MMTTGTLWLAVVVLIVCGGIGLAIMYAVIKASVLAALREHTLTSVAAVSITSAVPLRTRHVDEVAEPEHSGNG